MQIEREFDLSRIIILFALGFLFGCIYMNGLWKAESFLQLSERKYALDMLYEQNDYRRFWEMSYFVLCAIIYFFTMCSGFTQFSNALSYGFCIIFGIWWGALLSECMIIKGISSIWYIMKIVMPETIVYMIAYIFCLIWSGNMSTNFAVQTKHQKRNVGKYRGIFALSIILFLFWIVCSFYVNHFKGLILGIKIF